MESQTEQSLVLVVKEKPEGFGFVYCICPLCLLILGEDFFGELLVLVSSQRRHTI